MVRYIIALAVIFVVSCSPTSEDEPQASSQVLTGFFSTSTSGYFAIGAFSDVDQNTLFDVVIRKNSLSPWKRPVFLVRFVGSGTRQAYIDVMDSAYYLWDYRAIATRNGK
jgi:hypothetical protein